MTIECTRLIGFDAGHRLTKHESKCRNLHGHRYTAEVTCVADELDSLGRVVDFGVIKEKVGGWIDDAWDHGFIAKQGDPLLQSAADLGLKVFTMTCEPTAENMATLLLSIARELLSGDGVKVTRIRLWETPNSYVDVE